MSPAADRLVVTGVGVVSALGASAEASFERLLRGERGFGEASLFPLGEQRGRSVAEVRELDLAQLLPGERSGRWSRSDGLALLAARDALRAAGWQPGMPLSLAVGGTTGGMYEAEGVLGGLQRGDLPEAARSRLLAYPLSTTADHLADELGAERAITVCSACSSSAVAIVQGASWLASGAAELVLAGGTDGLCSLTFNGFNALGAMDAEPCRPFDVRRAGLTLGEGAGFLVIERESSARARGARILAMLSGWSILAEAHHLTHPEPSGATAAALLQSAIERAGLQPSDIDYVNAHGTGTPHNDAMEARALRQAFGEHCSRLYVSSSKGQIGHTLGAAGAIEAAITVLSLVHQVVPPTAGLTTPDAELPLRHVIGEALPAPLRAAVSSSFGFGGTGCVLAFQHPDHASPGLRVLPVVSAEPLAVTGAATWTPLGLRRGLDNAELLFGGAEPAGTPLPRDPVTQLDPTKSRRFDRVTAMLTTCAESALQQAQPPTTPGLAAGTAFGNVERCVEFLSRVQARGPRFANPAEFPHLVPSSAAGNASIYLGLTGPVVTLSDLATSAEAALAHAADLVGQGVAAGMVAGSAEAADTWVAEVLGPLWGPGLDQPRSEGAGFVVLERPGAARGRTLALLRRRVQRWGAPELAVAALEAPRARDRAVLLLATPSEALRDAIQRSAWAGVVERSLAAAVGWHEAIGGVALAAAAASLARGDCDEVLVGSAAQGRVYLFHLTRPDLALGDAAG